MKAVLIVHNETIDADVNDLLSSLGIDCYTKFSDVLGKGRLSEPHLNTEVWPGVNRGTLVVVDEATAKQLMAQVRAIRGRLGSEGVKAFVWQIEDVT